MKHRSLKQIQRRRRIAFIFRMHAWFTAIVLFVYAFLGFLWGPNFITSDLHDRWSVFADEQGELTVTARVLAPPAVPVVTVTDACLLENLIVHIDWANDDGSNSFDVYRDGHMLVSGLSVSEYDDTNAFSGANYSYSVIAYGPMGVGSASSSSATITTRSNCLKGTPLPYLRIQTVADSSVVSLSSVSTSEEMPRITGTSNVPNANVSISLVGANSVYASVLSNSMGYWEWTPSSAFSSGIYTLTVIVTDPTDPLVTTNDVIELTILSASSSSDDDDINNNGDNDDDDNNKSRKKKKNHHPLKLTQAPIYEVSPDDDKEIIPSELITPIPASPMSQTGAPASAVLDISNAGDWVFQWRTLETTLRIDDFCTGCDGTPAEVIYSIVNADGEKVLSFSRHEEMYTGIILHESISIPRSWPAGEYTLKMEILFDSANIERQSTFRVVELPVFDLGAGMIITWNDLFRALGWTSFWSSVSLLFVSFLFIWEYWLYIHLSKHITEVSLWRQGFFGPGKGVGRK